MPWGYRSKNYVLKGATSRAFGASQAHLVNANGNKLEIKIELKTFPEFTHCSYDREKAQSILANMNNSYASSHIVLNSPVESLFD